MTKHKIYTDLSSFILRLNELRMQGKSVVFTNGCFDILHSGHVQYLEEAAALADILVLGVNDDASVKALKGEKRPVNPLEDRMVVLAGLASLDFVIPFGEETPLKLIKAIQPNVLVKGGDYTIETIVGAKEVMAIGGKVKVLSFKEGVSTSSILSKLENSND